LYGHSTNQQDLVSPLLPDLKGKENFFGLMGAQSRQILPARWEIHALFFLYAYGKTIHNLPDIITITATPMAL
jgi:hypothetical protein